MSHPSNMIVDSGTGTLLTDLEFAVGDTYLDVVNTLLEAINYHPLYADLNGSMCIRKNHTSQTPDFKYSDNRNFKITSDLTLGTDIYDLPNVIVGVYSSPDQDDPITYTKENDSMESIISTVNRGYKVVKVLRPNSIASLADLTDYVEKVAFQAMQSTETVSFITTVEGDHEVDSAIQIDTEKIKGLFIEKSWIVSVGTNQFDMSHTVERKVFV